MKERDFIVVLKKLVNVTYSVFYKSFTSMNRGFTEEYVDEKWYAFKKNPSVEFLNYDDELQAVMYYNISK